MKILVFWLIRAIIIFFAAYIVPGFRIDNFTTALVVVIILGVLNLFIKPLLLFFTLPINLLTLGLFTFVINALLLELAAYLVPKGVHINSFLTALIAAVVIGFLSAVAEVIFS